MKVKEQNFPKKPNTDNYGKKAKRGFTIVELMVVIVIISIVAAIAVPAIFFFIRAGQQTNRMNIARTMYLAAQSELTAMRLDGTLGHFFNDVPGDPQGSPISQHFTLPSSVTLEEDDSGFIHYVTTAPLSESDDPDSGRHVRRLLQNAVLDAIVLEHAIVIEFNIETGVVLSVFYSDIDEVVNDGFDYLGTGDGVLRRARNISGNRPYTHYSERRQGYFGVSSTGELPDAPPQVRARIFDGERHRLNAGITELERINVLYAEFLLDNTEGLFTFQLESIATGTPVVFERANLNLSYPNPSTWSLDPLLGLRQMAGAADIYYGGTDTDSGISRFVWIIDYIQGDLFATQLHTIASKNYPSGHPSFGSRLGQHTVRAVVREAGIDGAELARSPMTAHTHFAREMPDSDDSVGGIRSFEVTSARHLHNIRLAPQNSRHTQTADIDMRPTVTDSTASIANDITNFVPILIQPSTGGTQPFVGEYTAMYGNQDDGEQPNSQYLIKNLSINIQTPTAGTPPIAHPHVGLFATLGATTVVDETTIAHPATIQGIALFNAEITAPHATNVGAIAGHLYRGRITQSWAFADVVGNSADTAPSDTPSTGGLVGLVGANGRLDNSFNAGFFDHHVTQVGEPSTAPIPGVPSSAGTGFVNARRGYVGGLVGTNNGTILGSFNNARVNISTVMFDPVLYLSQEPTEPPFADDSDLNPPGGIAGINHGTISNSYATNLVGLIEETQNAQTATGYGIARNAPNAMLRNNFFIGNGAESDQERNGQTRVTKDQLSDSDFVISNANLATATSPALPASIFEPTPDDYEEHAPGENRYFGTMQGEEEGQLLYPYPIITNNNPFERIYELRNRPINPITLNWGWEDVLGEIGQSRIVYYELMHGTAPVSQRLRFRYEDTSDRNAQFLVPNNSMQLVESDGYSIELGLITDGYTVVIEEPLVPTSRRVFKIVYAAEEEGEEPRWHVREEVTAGEEPVSAGWLSPQDFSDENDVPWQRFFIPNHVLDDVWQTAFDTIPTQDTISISVFQGHPINIDDEEPIEDPEIINPLFAPVAEQQRIRSPRHIQNIGRSAHMRRAGTNYVQQLNVDFSIYRTELMEGFIADQDTPLVLANAVVVGEFNGTFNGQTTPTAPPYDPIPRFLAGVTINAPNADNAGLFATNNGTIQNVTMRDASIIGQNDVGAVAGLNNGRISNISVQQVPDPHLVGPVTVGGPPRHRPIVSGISNVGGIVGRNNSTGTLQNVTVVSTSDVPAVESRNGASSIGGIVGHAESAANSINNLIYLAVTPRTGSAANLNERPYFGTIATGVPSPIGQNTFFLSSPRGVWPEQTFCPITGWDSDYNYRGDNLLPGAHNTERMIEEVSPLMTTAWSQWNINANVSIFTDFPYPWPQGTVMPVQEAYTTGRPFTSTWPLAYPVVIETKGIVYYEIYEDGEIRVFTNRFEYPEITNPNDPNFLTLANPDYGGDLRPQGSANSVVVEAGYAINITGIEVPSGNASIHAAQHNGTTWVWRQIAGGPTVNFHYDNLRRFTREGETFVVIPFHILYSFFNQVAIDATQPILLWVNAQSRNPRSEAFAVFAINPYFAKAVYPIRFENVEPYPILQGPWTPTEHYVRTPWQMQQISRLSADQSYGHTFNLDLDLDFSVQRGLINVSNMVTSLGGPGYSIPSFAANVATEQSNMASFVRTLRDENVANVVSDRHPISPINDNSFAGTFEGGNRTISNLSIVNTTPYKGLFHTIDEGGEIRNLRLDNINMRPSPLQQANGNNNAILASTNNGNISNITIANSFVSAWTATGSAGGVVNQNNATGTISNVVIYGIEVDSGGSDVSAGSIAATNRGRIRDVFVMDSQIRTFSATGVAGGIAGSNIDEDLIEDVDEGIIENAVFVSPILPPDPAHPTLPPPAPVIAPTFGFAGGIVGNNAGGTVANTLYIAQAPTNGVNEITTSGMITPITGRNTVNSGTVENSFFLRGTHSLQDGHNIVNASFTNINHSAYFNTQTHVSGEPRTTHELNRMLFELAGDIQLEQGNTPGIQQAGEWRREIQTTGDALQRIFYPYPFIHRATGITRPSEWPIATNQAIRLVYFEDYYNAGIFYRRGYWTGEGDNPASGLPGLIDDDPTLTIGRHGYGVIVPVAGGYTVREHSGTRGGRYINSREAVDAQEDGIGIHYIEIYLTGRPDAANLISTGNDLTVRVIVNDIPLLVDAHVNTNFGKAIFADPSAAGTASSPFIIRTPEQLANMNRFEELYPNILTFVPERGIILITTVTQTEAVEPETPLKPEDPFELKPPDDPEEIDDSEE